MKARYFVRTLAWGVGLLSVTAFSNAGNRLVHSVRGPSLMPGCDKCADWGNNHIFEGVGAMFDCEKFNACHGNMQSGWCSQYHWNCEPEEDEALLLHENAPVTTERLAAIAASLDEETVAAFLADNADRVQYNADRQVLQLIGCGGKIYAQYPVSEKLAAAFD